MFLYLWFFREIVYFGLPTPPDQRHTYYIQLILSLKLVGLAFEVKDATLKCRKASKEEYEQIPYHEKELAEITLRNIFGYCFNYATTTGFYITYRTYRDSIVEKYSSDEKLDEACERHIVEKFKLFLILTVLYIILIYFWPFERMFEDEFYTEQSILFRIWYIWITFFIIRIKLYNILIMSEYLFSAAGVGAYPSVFQSIPGGGPRTKDPQLLEDWDGTYDFATIKGCDIYSTETCLSFREFWRNWNNCVQYWMVINVYKRFPNRRFREGVTFLVSAYWHGVSPGYYFSIALSALYLPIEDLCLKRLRSSFPNFPLWLKVSVWINKFFALSYLIIAFQLLTFPRFWKYYSSVFHFGYIIFACQYALAFFWPKISMILSRGRSRPYVTYRTYRDSFVEKYSSDEKLTEACERNIVEKFKPLPFIFFVCLVANYFWPLEKMFDDSFYTKESFLLRMWYIWPVFLIFRMKMYCALIFSECLFSAAGIGAYPSVFQSIPGRGPRTKDPQLLEDWDGTYDFNTIKNCDIYTVETCWNFRDYSKSWNMCVQYWMVMNVHKRFPFRKFRTAATLLVSAFWHGSDSGYYFSITMGALYVLIEDLCLKRLRSSFGVFPLWLKVCLGFYNIFAFSYMAMAFQLVTFSRVWRYYNSVFYYGYIVFACQFALALFWPKISIMLLGRKPRSSEKAKENGNGMVS
uniref:Lysophospholipid acyltransferase 7 n=1 Tax=Phlebotomus papatasi TaxID=29031 RepID=A0A1B0GQI9_PHLPP